jgi:hypothetical protein
MIMSFKEATMEGVQNWLALFIAITHYRQIDIDRALEAAIGYYKLPLTKETITIAKVQRLVRVMENKKFSNVERLEKDVQLDRSTIIKLYTRYKEVEKNVERQIDYSNH